MSQENIEIVRTGYDEFNRTGQPTFEFLDSEVQWHSAADLPDTAVWSGHEGVAQLFSEWVGSFEDFSAEPNEFLGLGDYVVVSVTLRGRAKDTGVIVELPETHVWKLRNKKAVEVREYRTKEEALEAVTAGVDAA